MIAIFGLFFFTKKYALAIKKIKEKNGNKYKILKAKKGWLLVNIKQLN